MLKIEIYICDLSSACLLLEAMLKQLKFKMSELRKCYWETLIDFVWLQKDRVQIFLSLFSLKKSMSASIAFVARFFSSFFDQQQKLACVYISEPGSSKWIWKGSGL